MNNINTPTFEQESDPEYMRNIALQELKELNAEEYENWFKTSVSWFKDHYDSLMAKFKELYPDYYNYICNRDNEDTKHIDEFTDGIDLLLAMNDSKIQNKLFILSMQRKYVDNAIEKMKQILL